MVLIPHAAVVEMDCYVCRQKRIAADDIVPSSTPEMVYTFRVSETDNATNRESITILQKDSALAIDEGVVDDLPA